VAQSRDPTTHPHHKFGACLPEFAPAAAAGDKESDEWNADYQTDRFPKARYRIAEPYRVDAAHGNSTPAAVA
jgi:hypothetical protein